MWTASKLVFGYGGEKGFTEGTLTSFGGDLCDYEIYYPNLCITGTICYIC